MCIQLEWQVSNKFQSQLRVYHPRSHGSNTGPISALRGKEGAKCLRFVCIPACEVTNLIKPCCNVRDEDPGADFKPFSPAAPPGQADLLSLRGSQKA